MVGEEVVTINQIYDHLSKTPEQMLIQAIVVQALEDIKRYKRLCIDGTVPNVHDRSTIEKDYYTAMVFLHSQWFDMLMGTQMDGDYLIEEALKHGKT